MADVNANIGVNIDTSDALNQLKNLQRQISQFHQSVAKSSSAAAIAQRDLQKNFVNGVNAIQGFSAELRTVRTSAESFTNSLEKNKFSIQQYFRYAASQTKTFGKNFTSEFATIEKVAIERVKTLQTQYVKMGRDASGAMQAIAIRPTVLNMKDLGTQTAIAAQKQVLFNQLVKQGSTNLLNFGKNTQWAGRQLMVGFTLPLATLGMTAGRVFMDMEKAAIKFKKVYGDLFTAPEETQKAMDAITELGIAYTKYGVAVSDSLNVAADAAAAGFQGVDLQNQTTASLKLSVLGQMELQKALETTIALQNAFRISSEELSGTIDFLNAVENQTVVSLDDITEATPRVATVIQALGGDVKDLAFFLAAMKEGGVNAAQGANALKSGLASLINPTERASEMLMSMGINIRGIVSQNAGDLRGTVIGFAQALDRLDPMKRAQAIEQLFGKFQFARISALFDNVIRDGSQASRVLDLAGSSLEDLANLSEKELGVSAASAMNKFRASIEQVKVALAPIGELFLEIATPFVDFATGVLKAFNNLPDAMKRVIGTVIGVVGGLGPILLMTFGLINNGIANMIKFFATVRLGYLKMTGQAKGIGDETQYMTQEQLEAAAAAASLDQAHAGLTQRFTAEKTAVDALRDAYSQAAAAGARFATLNPGMMKPGFVAAPTKMAKGGVVTVGGRGNKDTEPALLTPGEAVIPAAMVKKYQPLIQGMIAGNIPGYAKGVMLGMPKSAKSVSKGRDAAEEIYQMFLKSSYAGTPPTNYGHQISPTSGHSFPIFGLGGVYQKGNKQVFVKPVIDEKAALAEMRSNEISRRAHGLEAPQQRIVVIRDPMDTTRTRRFLALESDLDPKFINNQPMGLFNEEQYFRQLVASLLRVDKDLSGSNVFGNIVADAGPAGVFNRASGVRDYQRGLPSMEDQALINLLGIRGGAKRAFAESTLGMMAGLTPQQYKARMLAEIQKVIPRLKQTIASFGLTNPTEVGVYDDMIRRLEQGLGVDWSKFHAIHSAVKPAKPKVKTQAIPGYKNGVLSVPGPKGAGDVVPAMLSPGEAVIPTKESKKYGSLIQAIVSDSVPGYRVGNIDNVTSRSTLGEDSQGRFDAIGIYEEGRSRTASTSRRIIDEKVGAGRGEELQAILAEAKVSLGVSIRLMSQGADIAKNGVEAYNKYLETLKKSIKQTQLDSAGFVADSDTLRQEVTEATGFRSKSTPKGLDDFTHAGSGVQLPAKEVLKMFDNAEIKLSDKSLQRLESIVQRDPNAPISLKSGFGIEKITHSTNAQMAGSGAAIETFEQETLASGISKWNAAIQNGGGNVDELSEQAQTLDNEFQRLIASVERGTKIFDTEAQVREAEARGEKAVSFEGLAATARANTRGQTPELDQVLTQAQGVAVGIRGQGKLDRALDTQGRKAITSGTVPALVKQGQVESSRTIESLLTDQGKREQEAYKAGAASVTTPQDDPFMVAQDESKRASPHQDAAALGKQDQEAYNKGAESAVPKDTRKIRGASSDPDRQAFIDKTNQEATQATRDSANIAAGRSREPRRVTREADSTAPSQKIWQKSTENVSNFSSNISKLSFGISALSGIAYAFGADLGGVMPILSGASAALFGLIEISRLLTGTKIAEIAATRLLTAAKAQGAVGEVADAVATNNVGNMFKSMFVKGKGLAGFFTNIGKASMTLLRSFGWIGLAVTALSVLIPFIIDQFKKHEQKVSGLGDAAFVAGEKLKAIANVIGFEPTRDPAAGVAQVGDFTGAGEGVTSQAVELRQSEGFKALIADGGAYKESLDALKNASVEDAQQALNTLVTQLIATAPKDFDPAKIQQFAAAIAAEAGKTDLDLSLGISLNPFEAGNADKVVALANEMSENILNTSSVSLEQVRAHTANFGVAFTQFRGMNTELTAAANNQAASISAFYEQLKTGLINGIITSEQYVDQTAALLGTLSNMPEVYSLEVLSQMLSGLGIDPSQTKGITDLNNALLVTNALMTKGAQISEDDIKLIDKADDPGATEEDRAKAAAARVRIETEMAAASKRTSEELERLKDAEEALENQRQMTALDDYLEKAEEDAALKSQLEGLGYSAAQSQAILNNEMLRGAFITHEAAGTLALFNEQLAQYNAIEAAKVTSGGGQKSAFQEAIDSLKEQQKEAKSSIMAYAKLRSAGFGVAEAFEIAKDSMLAAALASTQVGSKKWNELVTAIKAARAEEEAWLRSTPEGRAEQFSEVYSKVMDVFNAQEDILEMNNRTATATNRKIIETLEKQIDVYERRSSELQRDLDQIAEKEDEINKAYDEKTKALETVKKLNQDIINQQKSQLSIADALSRGDISAAAAAMEDARAQSASAQGDAMGTALDASRQSQLNALTQNGKTRKQIEEEIKRIKKDISDIEFGALQNARDAVEAANEALETAKENYTVQGQTKTQWEDIDARINASKASAALYEAEVLQALENAKGLVGEWSKLNDTFTTTHVVNVVRNDSSGTGTILNDDVPVTPPPAAATPPAAVTPPAPAKGTISNPYVAFAGSSGTSSITVPLGSYVKMPKNQYMHGQTLSGNNVILRWGPAENNINGRPVKITGNSIKAELGLDGKLTPLQRYALGGYISGPGTATSDSVPAMLSDGEYVIKAASVNKFGQRFLDSINAGKLPGFKMGGIMRDGGGSSKKPTPPKTPINIRAVERAATTKPVGKSAQALVDFIKNPKTAYSANLNKVQLESLVNKSTIPAGLEMYRTLTPGELARIKAATDAGLDYKPGQVRSFGGSSDLQTLGDSMSSKGSTRFGGANDMARTIAQITAMEKIQGIQNVNRFGMLSQLNQEGILGPNTRYKLLSSTPATATTPGFMRFGAFLRALGPIGYLPDILEAGNVFSGNSSLLNKPQFQFAKGGLATNKFAMGGLVSPKYFAMGGLVSPKYFANGGMAQGTDTVPAMLSPGEFVVNKKSTDMYGPLLAAMNSSPVSSLSSMGANTFSQPVYNMPSREYADVGAGMGVYSTSNSSPSLTSLDNSVYNNYSLSVNVEGTNASANDIANVVMNKIKTIDSQQVRRQVLR